MLVWDDLNPEERIKIYDKGMDVTTREGMYHVLATPRAGEMYAPVVPDIEALKSEVEYFVKCIGTRQKPMNSGEAGLRIVSLLEATDKSLAASGKIIELN